jgi:5-formyltetrahydrofolate cyclo-ligase
VADEKKNLRTIVSECRAALAPDYVRELSSRIERRIFTSEIFRAASAIILYAPKGNEVSTDEIFAHALAAGLAVFYPRVDSSSGAMTPRRVFDRSNLAPGTFGILEPAASSPAFDPAQFPKTLICVPGVAFGIEGARLGRGGGHYDRFLSQFGPEAISVGLACSFQLLDRIPEAGFDRRLNFIVTESDVHRACGAPLPADETRTKEVNPGVYSHGNPGIHSWWRGLVFLGDNETA